MPRPLRFAPRLVWFAAAGLLLLQACGSKKPPGADPVPDGTAAPAPDPTTPAPTAPPEMPPPPT